jgi:hypothetical protein
VARRLLARAMTLALIIGLPIAAILVYGFWLAAQLRRGPVKRP